jgi:hypothetical protein
MAGFAEELEAKLVEAIRQYHRAIKEAYRSAGADPQAVDGALDAVVAAVIRELEDAGYHFDTGALDNVLYLLGRRIAVEGEGWQVMGVR